MGNFTKKRLKTSKELIKDMQKGDMSITKNEFSIEETVDTIKFVQETYEELREKVDELKVVHNKIFKKSDPMP